MESIRTSMRLWAYDELNVLVSRNVAHDRIGMLRQQRSRTVHQSNQTQLPRIRIEIRFENVCAGR